MSHVVWLIQRQRRRGRWSRGWWLQLNSIGCSHMGGWSPTIDVRGAAGGNCLLPWSHIKDDQEHSGDYYNNKYFHSIMPLDINPTPFCFGLGSGVSVSFHRINLSGHKTWYKQSISAMKRSARCRWPWIGFDIYYSWRIKKYKICWRSFKSLVSCKTATKIFCYQKKYAFFLPTPFLFLFVNCRAHLRAHNHRQWW